MPQPLRRRVPDLRFLESAIVERSDLAVEIVRISAAWATVEALMGLLLAAALDSASEIGVAMYQALAGSAAQDAVLSAAVEAAMPPEHVKEFFVPLLADVRARGRERNRVIHCMWGVSPSLPDAIVSAPPHAVVKMSYKILAVDPSVWLAGQRDNPMEDPAYLRECFVYRKTDFEQIRQRMLETHKAIRALIGLMKVVHRVRREQARSPEPAPGAEASEVPPRGPETT